MEKAQKQKRFMRKKKPTTKKKVFVVSCTKEGLKFQMVLGPLKFERRKRGEDYTSRKTTVATI